jgi:branched-chain amino acid transport system permease protein
MDLLRRFQVWAAKALASPAGKRAAAVATTAWRISARAATRGITRLRAKVSHATARGAVVAQGVARTLAVAMNRTSVAMRNGLRRVAGTDGALRTKQALAGARRKVVPALAAAGGYAARSRSAVAGAGRAGWDRAKSKTAGTRLEPHLVRVDKWIAARRTPADARYRIAVAADNSRRINLICAVLLCALVALPAYASRDLINDLIFVFTMLALAQFWNLLAGYAGLVSVGQQAYVGLGGYLLFAMSVHARIDPLAAIVLAGVVAAMIALPTALVVFRLRGAYFAIGTWVMAEVYRLVFAQFRQLGGGTGTSLPPYVTNEVAGIGWVRAFFDVRTSAARDMITYWSALTLAVATIAFVHLVLRSRYGLALAAIRDSETAAESVGVDNFRTKLKVYIATAAGTGMVGALIYLQKARISPDAAFSVLDWTAYVIFIVVIGGIGTIEGPIVGVLVFYVLQTNLAHFGTWYLILLGVFAIVTMLYAPQGIWGFLSERYGLTIFPTRRLLVESSALAETPVARAKAVPANGSRSGPESPPADV